jgi:sugar/nucleoside kinase (ribokinase family)
MFDLCGLGNSCIDIVANIDDDFLRRWNFPKSICSYLTLERADALEAALPSPAYIPGGCAANTAACVIALGGTASFMGRVAKDKIGEMSLRQMRELGIRYTGAPDTTPGAGSTRVFALITPDSERTFASYYGVQEDLSEKDLDEQAILNSRFMYLDGYALNSRLGKETFLAAAEIAHRGGNSVVFSPSDISILRNYPDAVSAVISVTDIIFCNEQEAQYMTGFGDIDSILTAFRARYSGGAITAGEKGAYVFDDRGVVLVPAVVPPGPVTDTNGAGDAFVGGFLFGLSRDMPIEKAGRLGNVCAASIITHPGARPVHDYKRFLTGI